MSWLNNTFLSNNVIVYTLKISIAHKMFGRALVHTSIHMPFTEDCTERGWWEKTLPAYPSCPSSQERQEYPAQKKETEERKARNKEETEREREPRESINKQSWQCNVLCRCWKALFPVFSYTKETLSENNKTRSLWSLKTSDQIWLIRRRPSSSSWAAYNTIPTQ